MQDGESDIYRNFVYNTITPSYKLIYVRKILKFSDFNNHFEAIFENVSKSTLMIYSLVASHSDLLKVP